MKTKRMSLIASTLAIAALALAGCAGTDSGSTGHHDSGSSSQESSADHNDADVTFAQMMIPHHSQAVEMSDMVLAKDGLRPEVRDLAERIKAAQGPEITTMAGWLEEWGAAATPEGKHGMEHGGPGMDGMMSEDGMKALDAADAESASRLFLEQMIKHHEGAVDMAKTERQSGSNPEALKLADKVISSQEEEIAEIRKLLGQN
ncbi:DUF305 domain-containing protein [Saxibacter everestensis]|uniref:DUF305 domain-containing protein n=1 Tax=Saxibacter everestensis TaxID=2909229 RepID=A0ABY8QZS9_9MICO|nr:DUF305 domain-containing protein [Brevibacteriaceae bacterium ZFBP1038]